MKANRLVLLTVAVVCALSLSGCSRSAGGDVAATVNGTDIPSSDVNFLARVQCRAINQAVKDPTQASSVQTLSRKSIRASMVNALVQQQLNTELAKEQGVTYDRATYRQVMDQFEQTVKQAPAKDQARFRELVGGLYQGQLEVYAIAADQLAAQGVTKPTQDQIETLVTKLQDDFRAKAKISFDPVFGAGKSGVAGSEDNSLSKAVSSFAKASVAGTEDPTWAGKLPTNQKCG